MDKILTIEEMYNFEFTTKDMLLGMPFLDKYYPHIITKTHWWLTTPCGNKIGAKRVNNKQRKNLCKKLPKLYFPDENKTFTYIVETDSSDHSYGGVLKYKYEKEKIEHHCRYYSGS